MRLLTKALRVAPTRKAPVPRAPRVGGRYWARGAGTLALALALALVASARAAARGQDTPTPDATPPPPPPSDELPSRIPIFPLQDIMLFPGVPRPLHIFEPRYREMLADALEGDRVIGMVMLEPGHESEYYGRPPVYAIGCAGVLGAVEELADGRYNIVLHGTTKFRVVSEGEGEGAGRPYRLAEVEAVEEPMDDAKREALAKLRPRLAQMFAELTKGDVPTRDDLGDEELANGLAQYLALEPLERLELLKKSDPLERAEALLAIDRLKRAVARSAPSKR